MKGKVTIANSLITSLFQFPCSYIYTPPEVCKELRKIIVTFLWDGRRPKVAYNTLLIPTSKGGLGLIDLQTRIQAALIQTIRRILHEPRLGSAAYLRGVLSTPDLREYLRAKPNKFPSVIKALPYYNSMLQLWFKLHNFSPPDETSIRREMLWGNKWITNKNGPLQNEAWARKGITLVQNLCHHSEGRLLSHVEVAEKYNVKCTFLDMLALRLSIPLQWRESLTANWIQPNFFPGGPSVQFAENQPPENVNNIFAKQAYSSILAANNWENTAFHRWRNHDPATAIGGWDEWERTCRRIYLTTKETKFHSFQFKILHAITPCKKFLKRIRVAVSELCDHCGVLDDLFHFFFHCSLVQRLWKSICHWSSTQANLQLDLITPKEAILGVDDVSPRGRVVNFILLHFRFFVHRQKLFHDSKMELTHWLAELRTRLNTLQTNYRIDGKSHLFRPWDLVVQALG